MTHLFKNIFSIIFITYLGVGVGIASSPGAKTSEVNSQSGPAFTENRGQWNGNALFRLRLNAGSLFFEKDRLTFSLHDPKAMDVLFHNHDAHATNDTTILKGHAFYVHFDNCNSKVKTEGFKSYPHYENYFIGNDPSSWASNVKVYRGVQYKELYTGIDLLYQESGGHLKYSFVVKPNADPSAIALRFEGVDNIYLENGLLNYTTSANSIREENLFVYQEVNGDKVEVSCRYKLNGTTVSFEFPDGYDPSFPLVIDPSLIFGTYTGSTADNFGYTATDDLQGNFYAGGIARGFGYPTTAGAFQTTYAGGLATGNFTDGYDADMAISKFNSLGTALLYSTYIGGAINDQPQSMVVNSLNELCIYGRSNSPDFPTTSGAYNRVLKGGTDIAIVRLNQTGTGLVASTFVGGASNDGANVTTQVYGANMSLKYNYADDARGEIIVDASDNIYVASCSRSTDFPIVGGLQTVLGGGQDACLFKMNPALTALTWSTYLGGSGDDAAYSLALDSSGHIYTCGGTTSNNFPATTGTLNSTALGGRADGFIAHVNSTGSALLSATYIGTSGYDQCYFVQLDGDDNVYSVGLTEGAFPVTAGVYTNPNSGQFLISLPPDLSSFRFSTVFGRGTGTPDISPTAFLVDYCRRIFISGWGGNVNSGNLYGNNSSTSGLPITSDAFQDTTDGSDFYFIVFSSNATTLKYATYFGGLASAEHVDGGTSRFDKNGVIYQAVCAGCGGNSDFPSIPGSGVWSPNNPSVNCNLGAAKFEIEPDEINVSVFASPSTTGCIPLTITFAGISNDAKEYFWDFGDSTFSTLPVPTHTFTDTGTYIVTLIGVDSTTCDGYIFRDTAQLIVIARDDSISANFVPQVISNCDSFIVQLNNGSINATTYLWNFGDANTSTQFSPTHEYLNPGTYDISLIVTNPNSCNQSDTAVKQISLLGFVDAEISIPDTFGCVPFTTGFSNGSGGGVDFLWDFGDGDTSTLANPVHTYVDTGSFDVTLVVTDSSSCNILDTAGAIVLVTDNRIVADFTLDTLYLGCDSLVVNLINQSSNFTSIQWDFGDSTTSSILNPTHTYTSSDSFEIRLIAINSNACNDADTAYKEIYLPPPVQAVIDGDEGCAPHDLQLTSQSSNATSFLWRFWDGTTSVDTAPVLTALPPGAYLVTLTAYNPESCNDSATASMSFTVLDGPVAFFTTEDSIYDLDDPVIFINQSTTGLGYQWNFGDGENSTETNPTYTYPGTGTYLPCLYVDANNGCDSTYCKRIIIEFLGAIDLPNAFSPNGDGSNDILYVRGIGVSEIEFRIYNRWGELVFESTDAGIVCNRFENCIALKGWDGTYKGENQEMDVYVYTMKATFENGRKAELKKGNITLIR